MVIKNLKFGEVEDVIGVVFGNGTLSIVNGGHEDGSKSLLIKSKEFSPIGEVCGSEKSSDEFKPEIAIKFLNKESFYVFYEFVLNIKNDFETGLINKESITV